MARIRTVALFGVWSCWAQQGVPAPQEGPASRATGSQEAPAHSVFPTQANPFPAAPIEIEPPAARERPTGQSISLTQLCHRVPKEARKSVARAAKLAKSEDHQGAAEELEAAVRLDPEFADAYQQLGIEYGELGRPSDAANAFRRLLELSPDSVKGHCYLGLALLLTGDRAQSEQHIRLALRQSPEDARCQFLLGYVLWRQEATRTDGLQHMQNAARGLPYAKKFLRNLH